MLRVRALLPSVPRLVPLFLGSLCLGPLLGGCAHQAPLAAAPIGAGGDAAAQAPPPGFGRICVVRPDREAGFVTAVVRDNDTRVGAVRGRGCFCYLAKAGDHHISAEAERRSFDAWADVHIGKTYTLSLEVEGSFQAVVLRPRWIDRGEAGELMGRCGA